VLQDLLEHVEQEAEAVFRRLLPPPIPKAENSFRTSFEPQCGQETPFSPPSRTSASNCRPHFLQMNSYIGTFFILPYPEASVYPGRYPLKSSSRKRVARR